MQEYELLESELDKWLHVGEAPQRYWYPVVCSSGTAALHLAFEVLKHSNKEQYGHSFPVLVPDFSMYAGVRAVKLSRTSPIFGDVNFQGLMECPSDSLSICNILVQHTYGRIAETNYRAIHKDLGNVVEDLSECHGQPPNRSSFAACWSFYRNKIVAGEEGGAVAFRKKEHAELAKILRNLGHTEKHNFEFIPGGHNYRMSNLHAKPIRESLAQIEENLEKRQQVQGWYEEILKDYDYTEEELAIKSVGYRTHPWVFDLDINPKHSVDEVVRSLNKKGIQARCAFKPITSQEEFYLRDAEKRFPNSYEISRKRLYLPIHPKMTNDQVAKNLTSLQEVLTQSLEIIDSKVFLNVLDSHLRKTFFS